MHKYAKYMFALIFVSHTCDSAQDNTTYLRSVKVFDEDGIGVESEARRILDNDDDLFIGETDKSGVLMVRPPLACVDAKRIRIKLKDPLQFEPPGNQSCKSTVVFHIRRRGVGYLRDTNGKPVFDSEGNCVRTIDWTPALAIPECQGKK